MSDFLPTNPIVIVGCRRSGTTLLRTMLDRHPNLLVHPNEPQFFLELYERFGNTITDLDKALNHIHQHAYRAKNWDAVVTAFEDTSAPLSLSEFCQRYVLGWGGSDLLSKRVILKHPKLIFHLDLVLSLFPQTTIVHVVRDARANVASQRARWPKMTIWECAVWWRDSIQAGRFWQTKARSPYIEVRYEDLVAMPEQALSQLCEGLEIAYAPEMLSFELKSRYFSPDTQPEAVKLTAVDPTRLHLWQERLKPIEIKLIESICETEMNQLDYALQNPSVSNLSLAMRAANEQWQHKLRTTIQRIKNIS